MSRIKLLLLFFISLQIGVQAQIKAITETGEKVYLYEKIVLGNILKKEDAELKIP